MIVVNRFRDWGEATPRDLHEALSFLAGQRGYVDGAVGRNVDEPELWVLWTRWTGAGAYRRALSAYDVRANAWPVLARTVDEPSAYEVVEPGEPGNQVIPRGAG